jgi:DNA mismatch endonuclease (patch repair protein)
MDVLTPEQRQRCMARIKARNTKPEVLLRSALFARGLRYRLHQRSLPGTPDLVFPKFHAVVFIHGCFWHGHGCPLFVVPATNTEFWLNKIGVNRSRDEDARSALRDLRWRVLTVWECTLRGRKKLALDGLAGKIERWLCGGSPLSEIPKRS